MLAVKNKWVLLLITLFLYALYTIVYTISINAILGTFLEIIPGLLGIIILLKSGFTAQELYLYRAKISLKGFLLLTIFLIALVPILLTGEWIGFDPVQMLLIAPIGGITQELFFRACLLPFLIHLFEGRSFIALIVHACLFSIWHIPLVFSQAPLTGAIGVTFVTLIGGMIWGGQVQLDKTIYWAMGQHIIYLMLMSMFTWG